MRSQLKSFICTRRYLEYRGTMDSNATSNAVRIAMVSLLYVALIFVIAVTGLISI